MPSQPMRSFPLEIDAPQLALLSEAARGARLFAAGATEATACLALWRAGLLRVNGGSGFQLSQLGRAALRAHAGAVADPPTNATALHAASKEGAERRRLRPT